MCSKLTIKTQRLRTFNLYLYPGGFPYFDIPADNYMRKVINKNTKLMK